MRVMLYITNHHAFRSLRSRMVFVMQIPEAAGAWAIRIALIAFIMELGGSLYEYRVVDRVWPSNLSLIQPGNGGLDRKQFWMPLHLVLTLAIPVALWAFWREPRMRFWLLVTLALYVAIRTWTFGYFVPVALKFEIGQSADFERAKTWVRLSVLRAPLLIAATYAQYRAYLFWEDRT
jgi:hypothetical protein